MRWDIGPGYVPRILAGSGQSAHGRDGGQARSFAVTEVAAMVKRIALFTYGVVSYFIFLGTFLYAVGFIGGFAVPTRLDGERQGSLGAAVAVDAGLLALFAVQHSVMARRWFKELWARLVPPPTQRSTYVLLSSVGVLLLFALVRSMGVTGWGVS